MVLVVRPGSHCNPSALDASYHLYGRVERLYLLLGIFPRVRVLPPMFYLVFVSRFVTHVYLLLDSYAKKSEQGFRQGVRQSAKRVIYKSDTSKVHTSLSGFHNTVNAHPWCLSAATVHTSL